MFDLFFEGFGLTADFVGKFGYHLLQPLEYSDFL